MIDWLPNVNFGFLEVILAFVAIVIAIWPILSGRKKKTLVYKITTIRKLIDNPEENGLKIESFDGESVKSI